VVLKGLFYVSALALLPVGLFAQARPPSANPPAPVKEAAPLVDPNSKGEPVAGSGLAVDTKTYVIGPEDILFIRVWREQDFTSQYGVRPDGKISLPLVKDVQAAGLTPDKLGENLTQALGEYLNKPEVVVSVLQVNSKKYFITGEVNRPGQYPLVTPIRVFDALSGAGGFRDFANKKDIVVIRGGERLHFNYEAFLKGKGTPKKKKDGELETNFFMENGDTIVVK
jgi:polysaccharide biosynthesis/export protein